MIWDNYNQKPTTPPPTTPINQPSSVDEIAKITAPFQTEIASLKHQLETARQMPATPAQATPAHSGSPITWDDNFNWGVIGGGTAALMSFVFIRGKNISTSAVEIKDGSLSSELTGRKLPLMVNVANVWEQPR